MTKEDILHEFKNINGVYNNCMVFDKLSNMLDKFEASIREDCKRNIICNGVEDICLRDSLMQDKKGE